MTALTNLWVVGPRLKLLGLHISDDENVSTVMRFGSVAANQCKACYAGRHGRFTLDNILEILLKISVRVSTHAIHCLRPLSLDKRQDSYEIFIPN